MKYHQSGESYQPAQDPSGLESVERRARQERSPEHENDEHAQLESEIAANDATSRILEAQIVDECADMTTVPRESARPDLAIASYLQEKGSEAVYNAYLHMDGSTRQRLKEAVARGDLESVIFNVELHDPTNRASENAMHEPGENNEEFLKKFESAAFIHLERARTIAARHRALVREYTPGGEGSVRADASCEDTPDVKRRLAKLPLDMRHELELVPPDIRRQVIADDQMLEISVDDLRRILPRLVTTMGKLFVLDGRWQRGRPAEQPKMSSETGRGDGS